MIINIDVAFKPHNNLMFRVWARLARFFRTDRSTPIIIINFNRLECLKRQIIWLNQAGHFNIYILDNASTYPPLLEYYKRSKLTVFRLDRNIGHTAFWNTHLPLFFKNRRYVITDPDVVGVEDCPVNFLAYFNGILNRNPHVDKVGFGLKIDDLPACYPNKAKVEAWEAQFWIHEVEPEIFEAPIDTTFALYRENVTGDPALMKALRTGGKYMCRHLPWYTNPLELSAEDLYYQTHANSSSSWTAELKGDANRY